MSFLGDGAGDGGMGGIGSSLMGNGNPWMRNMMLAQMLMRGGQQQQQGGNPWANLAGAGGNVVQAMMLRRMLDQDRGQAQPLAQTPHPPTPLQNPSQGQTFPFGSQPSFATPPAGLGPTGQMPGVSAGAPGAPNLSNLTFPGGILPFGSNGGGVGSIY